jgi:hypothetical protein
MTRCPAFLLSLVALMFVALPARADFGNFTVPVAKVAEYEFTEGQTLGVVSGSWTASGGTFNSTSTATAIATIDSYIPEFLFDPEDTDIHASKFWYRARMLNQRAGSNTRVGIVYLYQDAANFYEASFSPTGSVFVRQVINGVGATVATGTYTGGGQNKWFDAAVEWTADETVILVNGIAVVRGIKQNAFTRGRVGLITRQTTAKFDRLLATHPYGQPEFRESFSGAAPAWNTIKGSWSVVNGAYQNSAVEHSSLTLLPIRGSYNPDEPGHTHNFVVRARMLNPYGGSGNRMGLLFGFEDLHGGLVSYREIAFGADGIARYNIVYTEVEPGGDSIVTTQATAPYPGRRGQWFDVTFFASVGSDKVSVMVDGVSVFEGLDASAAGDVGLVTHWTPGRFDDVWFNHFDFSTPRSENFEILRDPPVWFAVRGAWDQQGGALNNRSAGVTDIAQMHSWIRSTDYTLSARMLNPYGASGNRIGLIFNYDFVAGDYYEVVFAPTGQAYLNKFIQGQLTQIATATHTALGRNVWFNVELARRGPFANVKVNGQPVFQNVPAAQLDSPLNDGTIGLISHWAPGRFDDLHLEEYLPR